MPEAERSLQNVQLHLLEGNLSQIRKPQYPLCLNFDVLLQQTSMKPFLG